VLLADGWMDGTPQMGRLGCALVVANAAVRRRLVPCCIARVDSVAVPALVCLRPLLLLSLLLLFSLLMLPLAQKSTTDDAEIGHHQQQHPHHQHEHDPVRSLMDS